MIAVSAIIHTFVTAVIALMIYDLIRGDTVTYLYVEEWHSHNLAYRFYGVLRFSKKIIGKSVDNEEYQMYRAQHADLNINDSNAVWFKIFGGICELFY